MAVAVDTIGPNSTGAFNSSSPLTWTHTASGTNRAVVVGVSQNSGGYNPGEVTVTYGGNSMTFLGAIASNNNTAGVAWLFGLVNPPTGPQTVSVQRSAGGYGFIGGSVSFTGVNQTTPFSTAVTAAGDNTSGSTPPSASVSSATGNMVVDVVVYGNSLSNATGTLQWLHNENSSSAANNAAQSTYAGASSVTVGYNPTTHDWWGLVAVSINAASGSSSWINRSVLSGSSTAQNGTTSHTCTFTAATSGNLLVAVVSGSVTFTTPTGWTLVQSAVNSAGLYVFSKTASSGESSFSTTHNASNYPILGVVYEFPATSSVVGTAGTNNTATTTATTPICSGLSGVYTRFTTRARGLSATNSTASATWTVPTVKDYDNYNAAGAGIGIALTIAYDDACAGASFTPISNYSLVNAGAGDTENVSFAISTPGVTPLPIFAQGATLASGAPSASTIAATYTYPVSAGDLLVVALSYNSTSATATISDTLGNVYSIAHGPQDNVSLGFRDYIFYTVSSASGANSVTATISASVAFRRILIHEYSSLDSFDVSSGASGASGAQNSGSVTTRHPTELVFGWGISNNGNTTVDGNFILRETAGSESTEDMTVTTIGTYSADFPTNNSPWICQVATFYSSVGVAVTVPLPWLHF